MLKVHQAFKGLLGLFPLPLAPILIPDRPAAYLRRALFESGPFVRSQKFRSGSTQEKCTKAVSECGEVSWRAIEKVRPNSNRTSIVNS